MSEPRTGSLAVTVPRDFREHRSSALISVSLNTFWSIGAILLGFGAWDYYVDPRNWRTAFGVRMAGAAIILISGVFQTRPGRAHWMLFLAKVRLLAAVLTSVVAASLLDSGYGFGIAGAVVIFLVGPYISVDSRDLLKTNLLVVCVLFPALLVLPLTAFDKIGTVVYVLLAVVVSTLIGRVLEAANRRAFASESDLHKDARTDPLTGLDNRRAMQERGRVELKRARRTSAPVSIILVDLDHFKDVNDKHGHEVGDFALVTAAETLRAALRESDAIGRWGGEEFMVVLPSTAAAGAREVAERMRASIASTTFLGAGGMMTISAGVATSQAHDDPSLEWDLLIKEADQRLYRAKHAGRNRVVSE